MPKILTKMTIFGEAKMTKKVKFPRFGARFGATPAAERPNCDPNRGN